MKRKCPEHYTKLQKMKYSSLNVGAHLISKHQQFIQQLKYSKQMPILVCNKRQICSNSLQCFCFPCTMRRESEYLNKNVNQGSDDKICQCLLKNDLIMLKFYEKEEIVTEKFLSFYFVFFISRSGYLLFRAGSNKFSIDCLG